MDNTPKSWGQLYVIVNNINLAMCGIAHKTRCFRLKNVQPNLAHHEVFNDLKGGAR